VTKIDATVRDTAQGVNAKVLELTRFVGPRYHSSDDDGARRDVSDMPREDGVGW
jgi:hypothetical protein